MIYLINVSHNEGDKLHFLGYIFVILYVQSNERISFFIFLLFFLAFSFSFNTQLKVYPIDTTQISFSSYVLISFYPKSKITEGYI